MTATRKKKSRKKRGWNHRLGKRRRGAGNRGGRGRSGAGKRSQHKFDKFRYDTVVSNLKGVHKHKKYKLLSIINVCDLDNLSDSFENKNGKYYVKLRI